MTHFNFPNFKCFVTSRNPKTYLLFDFALIGSFLKDLQKMNDQLIFPLILMIEPVLKKHQSLQDLGTDLINSLF